jgi:hypothetical protein
MARFMPWQLYPEEGTASNHWIRRQGGPQCRSGPCEVEKNLLCQKSNRSHPAHSLSLYRQSYPGSNSPTVQYIKSNRIKYLEKDGHNICIVSSDIGRAIAQAVSRWLPTAAARIRARVWSSGICGGQSGPGAGFLRVLRFPLPIFIPPITP